MRVRSLALATLLAAVSFAAFFLRPGRAPVKTAQVAPAAASSAPSPKSPHPLSRGHASAAPSPDSRHEPDAALVAFDEWTERWLAAAPAGRSPALLEEGLRIARERRARLCALIPADPAAALAAAVPHGVRRRLPAAVLAELETPVSGTFGYDVIIACGGNHDAQGHADHVTRRLVRDGAEWRAFTYGERAATTSKRSLSAHGVSVDELVALHESPVRLLSAEEAADRGLDPAAGVAVEMAGHARLLPDADAVAAWTRALVADERRLGPAPGPAQRAAAAGEPLPQPVAAAPDPLTAHAAAPGTATPTTLAAVTEAEPTWTTGPKTLLYIRARFADEASDYVPIALSTVQLYQDRVASFLQNASYGRISLSTTYTDTVTLPSNAALYQADFNKLILDGRTAAKAANTAWDSAAFDYYVVVTSNKGGFPYAGKSRVGNAGTHLRAEFTGLGTAGHELGHTLGLWHANYWRTDSTSPIGADTRPGGYVSDTTNHEWIEYGHRFSLMGGPATAEFDDPAIPHFSVVEKTHLGWLAPDDGLTVLDATPATGTVVRLYRQDHVAAAGTRGVQIAPPSLDYTESSAATQRRYWLSYRRAFSTDTAGTFSPHGVQIDWARPTYGSDGAVQLDMTPFTRDADTYINRLSPTANYWTVDNPDKEDGQLPLGLTYSDAAAGIHFTPLATGDDDGVAGNGNEWIDVEVRLGAFPGNRPPTVTLSASNTTPAVGASVTFTATATDLDGDTLSYWWDFADGSLVTSALNNSTATKSWSTAGARVVRVVVSDRRGGQTTALVPVTVGAPANNTEIRGRVLQGGRPVSGARVSIGSAYQAWTDSRGRYVLSSLPAGSHTLAVRKEGLTFTAQFTNPVSTVAASQYGRDFYADQLAPGPVFTLSGRVRALVDIPMEGVEVEAAGLATTTDAAGNYSLPNLPPGTHVVTPRLAPYKFNDAPRSVTLSTGPATANFDLSRIIVRGTFSGLGTTAPTVSSLGVYSAYGFSWSGNEYYLNVPVGAHTIYGTLAGYACTPSVASPFTVQAGANTINFTAVASTATRAIVGQITSGGQPVRGATVALSGATTATTTTDDYGRYRFGNLAATAVTVTPSRAGYTFSPTSRSVTPATPDAVADFTVGSSTAVPVVSAATATATSSGFTLAATASGTNLSYRWVALTAPGPVAFGVNDSSAAHTTTATVSLPGQHVFRVTATNAEGVTATRTVTVSHDAPVLAITPHDVVAPVGGSIDFNVALFGTSAALGATSFTVSGGGSINASTGVFTAQTAGTYTVTATANGVSDTATLTVVPAAGATAPVITTQPAARTVNLGATATFTVAATGTGPLAYQWKRGTTNVGGNSATLTLSGVTAADAGNYTVVVSNSAGSVTSAAARLTVVSPPTITTQPAGQTVTTGANVSFSVVATNGGGTLAYQWKRGTTNVGVNSATLALSAVTSAEAGDYTVVVSNAAGSVTSAVAKLTVNPAPGYRTGVESSFLGTNPALSLPWTAVTSVDSTIQYGGWTAGAGIVAKVGDNALVFGQAQPAVEADSTLALAIAENQHWSVVVQPKSGALDLRSADIVLKLKRIGYHAARRYAVFTSVGGFAAGNAVFDTGRFTSTTEQTFTFQLPDTTAYANLTGPVEIRIVGYGGQYGDTHTTSITGFKLSLLTK